MLVFLHNPSPLDVMRILNPGGISFICAMCGRRKMMMTVPQSPILPKWSWRPRDERQQSETKTQEQQYILLKGSERGRLNSSHNRNNGSKHSTDWTVVQHRQNHCSVQSQSISFCSLHLSRLSIPSEHLPKSVVVQCGFSNSPS